MPQIQHHHPPTLAGRPIQPTTHGILVRQYPAVYPAVFTYPAALALGATGIWLGINLFGVARIYHRLRLTVSRDQS